MSDRSLLNALDAADGPKPRYINSGVLYRWCQKLGFAHTSSTLVQKFHDDGNGSYPRRASKRSVWKRLRRQGRNPGGFATR